jgi:hypothetical protein
MEKRNLLFLIILTFWLTGCDNGSQVKENPKTPEELRAELRLQEINAPLDYLDDKGVTLQPKEKKIRNGGLLRDPEYAPDGGIIEGDIINKATLAKFKDLVVKVSYYSQTKTLIEEKSFTFYEYYEPHSAKHFTMKVDVLPEAYKNFTFEITGATPVIE